MERANLIRRAAAGVVMTSVLLASVWVSRVTFLAVMDLIIGLGTWEFFALERKKEANPNTLLGIISALAISWCFFLWGPLHGEVALAALVPLLLAVELWRKRAGSPLVNVGATLLGVLYVGWLGSFPILIRESPRSQTPSDPVNLVILVFASIWIMDTLAYLVGSYLGRHKLFPRVSPKKSVEGFAMGLAGALLVSLGGSRILDFLSVGEALTIGIIVAVAGQVGDLVESLMKRDAGVKNSSKVIPGHGGILDRFDSCFFAFPIVYVYIEVFDVF